MPFRRDGSAGTTGTTSRFCRITGTFYISQQALHWEVPGFKRGPGRPRANRRNIVKKDLQRMGLTWEEDEVAALDRLEWHQRVAQYVHMDVR